MSLFSFIYYFMCQIRRLWCRPLVVRLSVSLTMMSQMKIYRTHSVFASYVPNVKMRSCLEFSLQKCWKHGLHIRRKAASDVASWSAGTLLLPTFGVTVVQLRWHVHSNKEVITEKRIFFVSQQQTKWGSLLWYCKIYPPACHRNFLS